MPKKREASEIQLQYVKEIKRRLNKALKYAGLNPTQLQDKLEKEYKFNINKNTLQVLFDEKNPNIDYACLVTTCAYFDFDFDKLLKPESVSDTSPYEGLGERASGLVDKEAELESNKPTDPFLKSMYGVRKKFSILRDEGYMGKFSGFIKSPTKSGGIGEFDLTIEKGDDGNAYAKLVRRTTSNRNCFEYHGVPYYSKAYKAVLIFMTDVKVRGEFYFLAFGFQQYRTDEDGLVFRQGLAVTGESLGAGSILAQNFILLNTDLSADKMKYVPGLLKAPNNEFCVPVDVSKKLAEKNLEVQQFMEEFTSFLEQAETSMYIVNEDEIISNTRSSLSKYDKIKALLMLKAESKVGDKYYYVADSKFSGFGKNYLAGADKEILEE